MFFRVDKFLFFVYYRLLTDLLILKHQTGRDRPMRTILCLLMLFVARQATAFEWFDTINSMSDLTISASGGLHAQQDDADSTKTDWYFGLLGGELAFYSLDEKLVLTAMAEGEFPENKWTVAGLEQQLKFPDYTHKLMVGQFLNPALNIRQAHVKRKTLGVPDATRRFTEYIPGGMYSVQKHMDKGSLLLEVALFERAYEAEYDSMFVGFPELPNGGGVRRLAYRLEFESTDLVKIETGFEQDVGHIFALSLTAWSRFEPRLGMSSFQRRAGEDRMNVFFAENVIWLTEYVALSGRLDFGKELEEKSQFGFLWQHQKGSESDGVVGVFYEPETNTISGLLTGALKF